MKDWRREGRAPHVSRRRSGVFNLQFLVAGLLLTLPCTVQAQVLRGTVTDSLSQRTIPGAVVTVLDARGEIVARMLTNAAGQYAIPVPAGAARVRVVRIGWRPRERAMPTFSEGTASASFVMTAIPSFLQPMRVDARQCPKRTDSGLALGLWEQVRDGLLAMVVAREQNLGSMVLIDFERLYRGVDDSVVRFSLKRTSTSKTPNSYKAARSASNFVRFGFAAAPADSERVFYAPDADVLIDPGFADGYCFRIVRPDRTRPNQLGLGFSSPDRRENRVDIDGALWVDTVARAIREIEFRYVGIHDRVDELKPGGTILFREMPNGVSFIQRWQLRMVGARRDSILTDRGRRYVSEFHTAEGGGELAHARWPDGTAYDADLGRAQFTLRTPAGAAAMGRIVGLAETPYVKTLDHTGVFEVEDLLPGRYALVVGEPRLRIIEMDSLPTPIRINVTRGTTQLVSATLPTLEEWTYDRCAHQGRVTPNDTTLILARILDLSGTPVRRASFKVDAARRASPSDTTVLAWETLLDGGRSDLDGLLQACTSKISPAVRWVRISGRLPDGEPYRFEVPLEQDRLTVVPLQIPRVIPQ